MTSADWPIEGYETGVQLIDDGIRCGDNCSWVVRQWLARRHYWNAARDRQIARCHLVSEGPHRLRRGTDEHDPFAGTSPRELRALGQKAVARMNRIDVMVPRDSDDLVDRKICLQSPPALADLIGLIGLEAVQGKPVLPGIDGKRPNPQLGRGAKYPDGDLGAIGDRSRRMELLEVLEITLSTPSGWSETGMVLSTAQTKDCRARRHGKFQGGKPGQARRVSDPSPMPVFRHDGISNPLTTYINDMLTI